MNKTKIEWCDYTWNPVVGCKRGCSYCYAKRMNNRFKWIENWNEPVFFPKRLAAPGKKKKPSIVFVGSVSDISFWSNYEINEVLKKCSLYFWHTFLFLTKSPGVYENWDFTNNCILGATVTKQVYLENVIDVLTNLDNRTYLSIEPLLGYIGEIPKEIGKVIVGAMTGPGAVKPEKAWIDSIKHPNIFYKSNIKKYL